MATALPPFREFTLSEIEAATEGFSHEVGSGTYGETFKGTLDGVCVVVKRIDQRLRAAEDFLACFRREAAALGSLRGPHLVPLLGACMEEGILVSAWMEGGTLQERMDCAGSSDAATTPLLWQDRVRIAYDIALGLQHLHHSSPPIVHRNLKPSNVLLDAQGAAYIGEAVITGAALTSASGASMHMDPECLATGTAEPMSDVYSLGVIMAQLLSGKSSDSPVKDLDAALAAAAHASDDLTISDQFDQPSDATAGSWPRAHSLEFASLARRCCSPIYATRPDLQTVLAGLADLAAAGAVLAADAVVSDGVSSSQPGQSSSEDAGSPPAPTTPAADETVRLDVSSSAAEEAEAAAGEEVTAAAASPSVQAAGLEVSAAAGVAAEDAEEQQQADTAGADDDYATWAASSGPAPTRAVLRSMSSTRVRPDVKTTFICPITQALMVDPVVAADGHTYERRAITAWLRNHSTSPLTREPLETKALVPNMMVRAAVKEWLERRHALGLPRLSLEERQLAAEETDGEQDTDLTPGEARAAAVEGLRSGDAERAVAGAAVLAQQAAAGEDGADDVAAEDDALEVLVAALHWSEPEVAAGAAEALHTIVQNSESALCEVAETDGAVSGLAAGFLGGGPGAAAALRVLGSVTYSCANAVCELVQCSGILEALVAAVSEPAFAWVAAHTLGNIASYGSEMRRRVAEEPGLMAAMVAAMQTPAPAVEESDSPGDGGDGGSGGAAAEGGAGSSDDGDSAADSEGGDSGEEGGEGGGEESSEESSEESGEEGGGRNGEGDRIAERAVRVVFKLTVAGEEDLVTAVADAEGMLAALAALLPTPANSEKAAAVLHKMAEAGDRLRTAMAATPGLLTGLVAALSLPDARSAAATALGEIANGGEELRLQVAKTPGALKELMTNMAFDGSSHAGWAICQLASGGHPAVTRLLAAEAPGLLTALIRALQQPGMRSSAVCTLAYIAEAGPEVRRRIVAIPGAPVAIASALQAQVTAAFGLVEQLMSGGEEGVVQRLVESSGLLRALAECLSIVGYRSAAAGAVASIAKAGGAAARLSVVGSSSLLGALSKAAQQQLGGSIKALHALAAPGEAEVLQKMGTTLGVLAALVGALDEAALQTDAAGTLLCIAKGGDNLAKRIASTLGAVTRLAAVAAAGGAAHAAAAHALAVLAITCDAAVARQVGEADGALAALLRAQKLSGAAAEDATKALELIAAHDEGLAEKVAATRQAAAAAEKAAANGLAAAHSPPGGLAPADMLMGAAALGGMAGAVVATVVFAVVKLLRF